MTWAELIELVDKYVEDKNDNVIVYDMDTGKEFECDVVEFQNGLTIVINK